MTRSQRRRVGGFLLPHIAPLLVLVAALALGASGCQEAAAPPGQNSGLSAPAQDGPSPTDPATAARADEPTAEPSSTPAPTAVVPPTATPTPNPTSTPLPATKSVSTPTAALSTGPVAGHLAPDLTLPDLNGGEMTLSNLRGKPVLLNFWTSW